MMRHGSGIRVVILCEDRLQEQFLVGLCQEHGIQVLHRYVAPAGKGAASAWVRAQYPSHMKAWRALSGQPSRGLLVSVDGDNVGVEGRKRSLDEGLLQSGVAVRVSGERTAVLVPTWSIETWLLFLYDGTLVAETEKSKQHPGMADLRGGPAFSTVSRNAMRTILESWRRGAPSPSLPSLADGRREFGRLLS